MSCKEWKISSKKEKKKHWPYVYVSLSTYTIQTHNYDELFNGLETR